MGKSSVRKEAETVAASASLAEANTAAEAPNSRVSEEIDAQIRRLRQVLALMAPETGSVALGSARRGNSKMPITERVRLLTEYRR